MIDKKFRAYDKGSGKYLLPMPAGFHILGEVTSFDLIGQQLRNFNKHKTMLELLNDVVIEQFIGITDMKNQDIYENDIVLFKGERWRIEYVTKRVGYMMISADNTRLTPTECCRVVGTIHDTENPPEDEGGLFFLNNA